MKKLYYLLVFIAIVSASCDPTSQTYKTLDNLPKPTVAATYTLTLGTYKSATDANLSVPASLATKYPLSTNTSNALVTFALAPSSSNVAVPDSTIAHVASTLVASDYTFPASTLPPPSNTPVPGNTTAYFTAAGVINYLNYKYPTPTANQLVVLTYVYFETGNTPTGGTTQTDSYIYLPTGWIKCYTITPAQYTASGRGAQGFYTAADYGSLAGYFNAILSSDPTVMGPAKVGSVVYVSYKFTATYQKIMTLTYDGSTWALKQTLPFLKLSGVWVPDPTIYITEAVGTNADYVWLNTNTTIGSTLARANVASFGDFDIRTTTGLTTNWSTTDVTAALAAILLHRFPNATIGVPYKVTYSVYTGTVSATSQTFVFDGTVFNQQQ